ncbi:MAG TPA: hypothetical protein VMH61_00805, partial [Candidatus Acidoferrales bacterium]|nr:hypothetical protein [Candidatus Acidoferrales bacterium]
ALARYPSAREVAWVQEEPENMGPWRHLRDRLVPATRAIGALEVVARPEASSPATGFYAIHQQQERELIERALGAAAADAPVRTRERGAMDGGR